MNFTLLLAAVRARRGILLAMVATTLVVAALVSYFMQKTYVASASLFLDGRDDQSLRQQQSWQPDRERLGYKQTQIEILSSPKVSRRVVHDLKLAEDPLLRDEFEAKGGGGDIVVWIADAMAKQIKIDSSQSNIIQLSYASSNPEFSAKAANAFAKAYIDVVLELRIDPTRQTSAWFNEQLKVLRDNVEQAQQKLSIYQRENGIVGSDERTDVENIQLAEMVGQLARSGTLANETIFQRGGDSGSAVRSQLVQAEAKLNQMASELGPNHPQYIRQVAEVQALRSRAASESRTAHATPNRNSEAYRQYRERLIADIAVQREKVLKQTDVRKQMAVLTNEAATAQNVYDRAMQHFMISSIDSRAMQTNVSILNAAVAPRLPHRPKLILNLAIALVVGTALGLMSVYLLEMLDRRVRVQDDLAGDPQIPVLAVLSPWNTKAKRLVGYDSNRPALPGPGYR